MENGSAPVSISEVERYVMINLRGRSTGLPMNIWIGPKGGARHGPRIKVQMNHRQRFDLKNLAVVNTAIDPEVSEGRLSAEDLELVQRYIKLNFRAIMAHWREETDGVELAQALRPLA